MNRKSCLLGRCAAVCLIAVLVSASASARTVYDAGKAFNEAGHNVNTFGPWSLLHASSDDLATTSAFDTSTGGTIPLVGIGGSSSPWVRVNAGSTSQLLDGEEVLPGELYLHPGNPTTEKPFDVVRFTAPQDGWYSAVVFAHDCAKNTTFDTWNPKACAGVQVTVRAGGNVLVRQIVSLEDQSDDNPSHRFDFQVPVRHLAAGETIEVVVGNKSATSSGHSSDATGLRFIVTKEDEGAFYDSGIALTNNIDTTYVNPYGNIKDGTWYYLLASVPAGTDFTNWAPANFNNALTSRISTKATRSDASSQRGFAGAASGTSPYVLVNETAAGSSASTSASSQSSQIAPCELHVHPKASDLKDWPVIRFRPPASGYYSASIVARDVIRGKPTDTPTPDGVHVYLLVSGTVVTNVYISAETFSSTAHLTFGPRLLVANEPVDIAMFANTSASSDATGISAIFRREPGDVYDAGKAFYANRLHENTGFEFDDLLGGGARWFLGAKTNAWCGAQFYEELKESQVAGGAKTMWWMQSRFTSYSEYPYFVMATNGTATADSTFTSPSDLLAASPQEFVAIVNDPGYQSSSPTLKATVPSDGVYRARSYARDLNNNGGDGVQVSVVANGHVAATSPVMRDSGGTIYETALGADRLWLKGGDRIEYVVDPLSNRTSDPTGLSACYEICDASPSARVINIDFGVPSSVAGRFSNYTGAGREGWSDWNKWNALRISDSTPAATVSIDNCREADGMTKRNVKLTLASTSGNVTKGYTSGDMPTGSALHNNWAKSDSASDAYTFTLSKLKKNEPYTLYLYSAKGGAEGNGSFTVGGVTKTADDPWNLKDTKVVARFDVASDSNGEISGTFAAADANGGAFNGLTLVGEFPEYEPLGMIIIFR